MVRLLAIVFLAEPQKVDSVIGVLVEQDDKGIESSGAGKITGISEDSSHGSRF